MIYSKLAQENSNSYICHGFHVLNESSTEMKRGIISRVIILEKMYNVISKATEKRRKIKEDEGRASHSD